MKNIKDTVIEFLKNENIKKELSEVFRPLGTLVYNVFLIFIILANLILLLKLFRLTEIISMNKN